MMMFSVHDLFATSLVLLVVASSFDSGMSDMTASCKSKVLRMSLKHCLNADVRTKRDVPKIHSENPETPHRNYHKRQISPQAVSALQTAAGVAGPIISQMLIGNAGESPSQGIPGPWDQGYVEESRVPIPGLPGYQRFGFQPPATGDDLGMGLLSFSDMEELYNEMIERLPRAAKDKGQTMKVINAYAASCCNEKIGDDACSDAANFINCPA